MSFAPVDATYSDIVWRMVIMACGLALTMAPATESIMGSLPLAKAGVGSAVNDTTRQVGGALGVAVLGSVFTSIYSAQIADRLAGQERAGGARWPRRRTPSAARSTWPPRSGASRARPSSEVGPSRVHGRLPRRRRERARSSRWSASSSPSSGCRPTPASGTSTSRPASSRPSTLPRRPTPSPL